MMHVGRPFTGSWPPIPVRGSQAAIEDAVGGYQVDQQRALSWWATAQRLGWLALTGLFLIIVGFVLEHDLEPEVQRFFFAGAVLLIAGLFHEGGVAALIAFVLAVTIDRLFRQEAVTDVVRTALGYVLPVELRDEMRWIYEQKFMARESIMNVELRRNADSETLTMVIDMQRFIENVTADNQIFEMGTAFDEWGFADSSELLLFSYRVSGGQWQSVDPSSVRKDSHSVSVGPLEIPIPTGGSIEHHVKFRETKRLNDETSQQFVFTTRNPRVSVTAPPDLAYEVQFAHRAQADIQRDPGGSYRLSGTLLPEQAINVRWWPVTD